MTQKVQALISIVVLLKKITDKHGKYKKRHGTENFS